MPFDARGGRRKIQRPDILESQAGADAFLHPQHGGIAIWVRREEMLPRAAVRFRTRRPGEPDQVPLEDIVMMLASLHVGTELMTRNLAKDMDLPFSDLNKMVETAKEILRPRMYSDTAILANGMPPAPNDPPETPAP